MIDIRDYTIKTILYDSESFSLYQVTDKTNSNIYISKVIKQKITDEDLIINKIEFFLTIHHPSFLPLVGFSFIDFEKNPYLTILCDDLSYISYRKFSESNEFNDETKSKLYLACLSLFNYYKARNAILSNISLDDFFFDQHQNFFPYVTFLSFEFSQEDNESIENNFISHVKKELNLHEINEINDQSFKKSLFYSLTKEDQIDIQLSLKGDVEKCLKIGKIFLNGNQTFPQNEDEGIRFLKYAADHGNIESQVLLMSLFSKDPTMQDESFHYCMMAAKSGDFGAISNLGVFYLQGKQITQNFESAVKCFKVAAEKGNVQAIMNLAFCLWGGIGVEKDKKKSLEYYKIAADRGVVDAMVKYGENISSKTESIEYLEKAAQLGSAEAFNKLGDLTGNVAYYKEAADLGNVQASTKYAYFKFKNNENQEALKYYKFAAENNDSTAIYNYQILLTKLSKCDQISSEKIIEYYRKAIQSGDVQSMLNLAELFEEGSEFIEKNIDESLKLYQMASKMGNAEGSLNCGRILEDYMNDFVGAISYYKLAVENDDLDALIYLAKCMDKIGGEPDLIIDLIKKSVEYENAEGMFLLGMMYAEGKYVDKDVEEAKRWLNLADENGFEPESSSIQDIIESL